MGPSRKRKQGIEEIAFDQSARHDYLTGFHKSAYISKFFIFAGCGKVAIDVLDDREATADKACPRGSLETGERREDCGAEKGIHLGISLGIRGGFSEML